MKERNWLKKERNVKNLTLKQVAMGANISECYYSLIENGKRNVPVKTAQAIAQVLGFNWADFYNKESSNA